MKRLVFGLSMALMVLLVSCDEDAGYTQIENGYAYKLVDNQEGQQAVMGDIMLIDLKSVYDGDSILIERTAESGFYLDPVRGTPALLKQVLDLCDEGDSVHVKMSLLQYALLTRMPINKGMDSTKTVVMHMRIAEVENESTVIARVKEEQRAIDKEIIQKYLADNNLEAEESPDGIFQIVQVEGTGPKPQLGQRVTVNYVLRLTNGKMIDTSYEEVAREAGTFNERRMPYKPYTFTVGNDDVIGGWHKGIPLVNKGGKSTLLIPSGLGYGTNVRPGGEMPLNAVLVFEVEVVDIK